MNGMKTKETEGIIRMRYAVCGDEGRRDEDNGSYFRIQPFMNSVLETSFPALTFLCVELSDLFRRKLRDIPRGDHQDKCKK
jgi:hypothetical protein